MLAAWLRWGEVLQLKISKAINLWKSRWREKKIKWVNAPILMKFFYWNIALNINSKNNIYVILL